MPYLLKLNHIVALTLLGVCPFGYGADSQTEEDAKQLLTPTGLTPEESLGGWLALFDGQTSFGFKHAQVLTDGAKRALQGGTTTTEFADFELRIKVIKGGSLQVAGEETRVAAGEKVLSSRGRRGPVALGSDLVVEHVSLKPLGLKPLWNGRDLTGWDRRGRVPPANQSGAQWSVKDQAIHVVGGPEALEYAPAEGPHLFDDFILQTVVTTCRPGANGGIFFRNQPGKTMMGYEAQLHHPWYDPQSGKRGYTTGAIDDRQQARAPVAVDLVPFRLTVIAHGAHIATWVNGYQTVDWEDTRADDANPRRGRRLDAGTIQLQAHDPETDLKFHGIWLRELH